MNTIGKYKICGLLGRGGMGKVFKVEVPVIGRILALKLLAPSEPLRRLLGRPELERLFIEEAVTMAGIRHPHVIAVFDFGTFREHPYFVMDYYGNNLGAVIGETYRTEAPSRILRIEKVVHYTLQMLDGLHRLHSAGIVHRDMKPYNLLLTENDTVKLCDFGLSKLRGEKIQMPRTLKVGSPFYAAPEQEENPNQVDVTADLYSVGVMVYRMLTGRLPLRPLEPARRRNPQLTPEWDAFLARSLSRRPAERFPDAPSMSEAVMRLSRQWESAKEAVCRWPMPDSDGKPKDAPQNGRTPRAHSIRTGPGDARPVFQLNDLWQPKVFHEGDFRNVGETVVDAATALQWQYGGSEFPLSWSDARAYVDALNDQAWSGHDDWRLPTVMELVSLLRPPPSGTDYCLSPDFAPHQKRLWSCDRRSFTSAWYVSMELGFVAWHDRTVANHAKAVRTA